MADPEHLKVVRDGRKAIARWRKQHSGRRLDLREADLSRADLVSANLWEANLSAADLGGADLFAANLGGSNLSGALLAMADLSEVDLSGADLRGASLFSASLTAVNLRGANLSAAVCDSTMFGDCDLSQAEGLDSVVHAGPSTIGIDTLIASYRGAGNRLTPQLETFFLGAGVPQNLLAELPRIFAEVQYCTAFICYGEPDLSFAQRLYQDLKAKGVSCWLYSMDATPGERTWREIGERRREAEKMIVLCSAQSLVRNGALKEIEEQIDEDPDKMVPISLDNLWKEDGFKVMRGSRDLKPFLHERNYADFSDFASYANSLERLLKGLERQGS